MLTITSKRITMLRPLSLPTDFCVQVDNTTGPSKYEVKMSDIVDLYRKLGFSDLFDHYLRGMDSKSFLVKDNV